MNILRMQAIGPETLAALAVLACGTAQAAVLQVPANYPNIQAAINAASNGDLILVAPGVYSGSGNHTIEMFGKAITLRGADGPANTIIDIQASQQAQRTGFYLHHNETANTVIEGFTIKNGYMFNGAAMMLFNSSPTIRDCVFTENHANCWGGAIYFDSGASPTVVDSKFINNFSADDGGAIFGIEGSPTFTNCEIIGNDGTFTGGAITTFGGGSPKLINSTVVGNHANWGNAIYSNNIKITNSIIWGNTGGEHQIFVATGWPVDVKYSIVQGGFQGTGNLSAAPVFADPANGDFHLLAGSPGIDAGDPASVVPVGTMDWDGDPRLFGATIDMGIDEFRKSGDVTGDHAVNIDDMLEVIGAWGPCSWSMADLNGDFSVNINDLLIVIGNWGA